MFKEYLNHFCKLIIWVKGIRLRYKYWVLCLFRVIPCQTKSINSNQDSLRFRVAKEILEVVNKDKWPHFYFDNFFSSCPCSKISSNNQYLQLEEREQTDFQFPTVITKVMENKKRRITRMMQHINYNYC